MAVIFRNGRIITGTGEIIKKGLVALVGPSIDHVGPEKRFRISKNDQVIDLLENTTLLGLIDCHVHLCMDGSPDSMA
jgi:imidazolonepropionase-like amidohydrolase